MHICALNPIRAVALCGLAVLLAGPAAAEETGASLFRKALLGHCFSDITGETLFETDLDLTTWKQVVDAELSTGSMLTANARVRTTASGEVIVDRSRAACFVQATYVDAARVAREIRDALQRPPFNAVVYIDKTSDPPTGGARKRSVTYGVVSQTRESVPVILVNEFFSPAPGVITGQIIMGRKSRPGS